MEIVRIALKLYAYVFLIYGLPTFLSKNDFKRILKRNEEMRNVVTMPKFIHKCRATI